MDLREQLLVENTKRNALKIAGQIINDSSKLPELIELINDEDEKTSSRAAYTLTHSFDLQNQIVNPHLDEIINLILKGSIPEASERCLLRCLYKHPIPEDLQSELFDYCIEKITSEKAAVAVRAFSISVAFNIAKEYPELITELKTLIEPLVDHERGALISRSRNTLKLISKLGR